MEIESRAEMLVAVRVENLADLFEVGRGVLGGADVRRVEVADARIDPRALGLRMPRSLIEHLGLIRVPTHASRPTYHAVRLTIRGRDCVSDVSEVADRLPEIVGRLPLLSMDWVVDEVGRRLIGNPEHGGEEMVDIF